MVTPSIPKLHKSLKNLMCPGGPFDVEPCEMDLNIGRICRLVDARGNSSKEVYRVVAVQKIHDGQKAYRVVAPGDHPIDQFGCPATKEEIEFLD